MMSTGTSQAGIRSRGGILKRRLGIPLVLLVLACVPACARTQLGDTASAANAADDFLLLLRDGDAEGAWDVLTPRTRDAGYDNEFERFAEDVAEADWDDAAWRPGPVTDLDISWGVHVEFESRIPDFLINGGIASYWSDEGLILLVQISGPETYLIAGPGLDTDSR